jgi:uncharacterized protein YndB with AHSA1/START domain
MPGFTVTGHSGAAVEDVWKLLFDPTCFPRWWVGVESVQPDDETGGFTQWPTGYPDFPMPQHLRADRVNGRVTVSCQISDIDFSWQLAERGTGTTIEVRVEIPESEAFRLEGQREVIEASVQRLAALAESEDD